jgi:hypothetical protein
VTEECRCHIRAQEGRRAEDREEAQARQAAWAAYGSVMEGPYFMGRANSAVDAALSAYREALCEIALRRLGVRGTK